MDEGSVGVSGRTAPFDGGDADVGSGLLIAEESSELQGAVRINVRAFTFRGQCTDRHSFLVSDNPTGLSSVLGSITIRPLEMGAAAIRNVLEYTVDKGMVRRSALYQELLFVMTTSSNIYHRPRAEMRKYRLGVLKQGEDIPRLIPEHLESVPIAKIVKDLFLHDLVVVPLSQLSPDDPDNMVDPSALRAREQRTHSSFTFDEPSNQH